MRTITEVRNIKDYERISKERLISSINELKPAKENDFNDARIEKIKIDFNTWRIYLDKLSKPK